VVVLCGRDHAHTRAVAERWQVPHITTDYEALCARPDVDAITIVSADGFHAREATAAFAGGKHVFCEKPLGTTVDEAVTMLQAANRSGRIHQVAFTFRYLYGVQELKRRLLRGDIGPPTYIRLRHESWEGLLPEFKATFRDRLSCAGGGVLHNVGSHLFDLVHYLVGPTESVMGFTTFLPRQCPHKVSGTLTAVETDDLAASWFVCAEGVRGEWFASRVSPSSGEKASLEIVGREGAMKASLSRGSRDALYISRPTHPEWESLPLAADATDGRPHCLPRMMRSYVTACLRGTLDQTTDASFHDGMMAQQAIHAVELAARRFSEPLSDLSSRSISV
jgi:predicted dehydrogenase